MLEAPMHKHVGKQLIDVKIGRHEEMESQPVVQERLSRNILAKEIAGHEDRHIHYQQILCYYRYIAHNYLFSLRYNSVAKYVIWWQNY